MGEPFCNLWYLLEEVRALDFFDSRRPGYVVREQVCENSLAHWDREPAEEKEAMGVGVRKKIRIDSRYA
jgi:hypothetical protein